MTYYLDRISFKVVAIGSENMTELTQLFTKGPVALLELVLGRCTKKELALLLWVNHFTRETVIGFCNRYLNDLLEVREKHLYRPVEMFPLITAFPINVPLKLYAGIVKDASKQLNTDVKDRQTLLKSMIKMECYTKEEVGSVVTFLKKFPDNKEEMLTALKYLDSLQQKEILVQFSQNQDLKPDENGLYALVIDNKSYGLGGKNPGTEQQVGIFLEDRLLSGKQSFSQNDLYHRISQEGVFNVHGLVKGHRVFMTNAPHHMTSEKGIFYSNGQLKEGKRTYLPDDINNFKKSENGTFYPDGGFEGSIGYEATPKNNFKKSVKGTFYPDGRFNGTIEYEPKAKNGFKKSQKGSWDKHKQFIKGKIKYAETTLSNWGFLEWDQESFYSYPSPINCLASRVIESDDGADPIRGVQTNVSEG